MSAAVEEVIVMDDAPEDAEPLIHELEIRSIDAQLCSNIVDLLHMAKGLDHVVFVIDIDMGPNRQEEGLTAIQQLNAMRERDGKRFLIAALTSHAEYKARAARAGVDIFIVKDKPQIDALEVITYAIQDRINQHTKEADQTQAELAALQYENLDRQLREDNISAALRSVHNALKWPRLLPNESALLTILADQLAINDANDEIFSGQRKSLLQEAVDMLRKDRARTAVVGEWLAKARKENIEVLHRWLEDEHIEDIMEEL
jgi:ActR/RegA family two-component response regulator